MGDKRRWLVLGAVGLVVAGWLIVRELRERSLSDRERIERTLRRLAEAVEENDYGKFGDGLCQDYQDAWGQHDRREAQQVFFGLRRQYGRILVTLRDLQPPEIDAEQGTAVVRFEAEVRAERAGGGGGSGGGRTEEVVSTYLRGNRLKLTFRREGRDWRVARAELDQDDR